MDLDTLRLALDVRRHGGFASVARHNGEEPSQISRAISALEAELGFRLFQRTTRRFSVTEAGEAYLQRVEPLLEGLDDAGHEAQALTAGPMGVLRITASVAFGARRLVPLMGDFQDLHPKVSVELVLTDTTIDLVAERIDLAIRLSPSFAGDLIGVRLLPTRYRVCATPDWARAAPPLRQPSDISEASCLLFDLHDYRRRWKFRGVDGRVETCPVSGRLVISSAYALYEAVKQGLGPALLPSWLIDEDLSAGRLIDLFPNHEVAATDFDTAAWLLYPSRAYLPSKTRAMIDFLKERLGAAA